MKATIVSVNAITAKDNTVFHKIVVMEGKTPHDLFVSSRNAQLAAVLKPGQEYELEVGGTKGNTIIGVDGQKAPTPAGRPGWGGPSGAGRGKTPEEMALNCTTALAGALIAKNGTFEWDWFEKTFTHLKMLVKGYGEKET